MLLKVACFRDKTWYCICPKVCTIHTRQFTVPSDKTTVDFSTISLYFNLLPFSVAWVVCCTSYWLLPWSFSTVHLFLCFINYFFMVAFFHISSLDHDCLKRRSAHWFRENVQKNRSVDKMWEKATALFCCVKCAALYNHSLITLVMDFFPDNKPSL